MSTSIGIKPSATLQVATALGKLLADEFVLYTKTRNAHWNVEGPDFHAMHIFFEEQYKALEGIIDDVAERIRSIGHYAPATLKQYLELTHLAEMAGEGNTSTEYIQSLLQDHDAIIVFIRENVKPFADKYDDAGSSDFITGLMEIHEKMAWMLRSFLK